MESIVLLNWIMHVLHTTKKKTKTVAKHVCTSILFQYEFVYLLASL